MDFLKFWTLKIRTSYEFLSRAAPQSTTISPFGSVTTNNTGKDFESHWSKFGFSQKRVLPEPEPPTISTFLLRAVFGSLGRLFMVRLSDLVRMTLFFGSSSTKGRISSALPQRAVPYSSPCLYFLAFLPLIQTARRSAAPQQMPKSRSVGCRLGKGLLRQYPEQS